MPGRAPAGTAAEASAAGATERAGEHRRRQRAGRDDRPAGEPAPSGSGSITVGSADFPESQLLAQIYGQALAAAGFDVSYELGIGAREVYFGAIESGEVQLVPEYTNSLLSFVLRQDGPERGARGHQRRRAGRGAG